MIENLALLIIKTATPIHFSDLLKKPSEKICIATNTTPSPIVPKILTFESKVPIKPFKLVEKLPEVKNFDFRFEVNPKKLKKNIIKISENGDFKLTIKKGNKFSVIDNDATDGNATIEIPENVINSFIGISEKDNDEHKTVTGKIIVEDTLYYSKQEIKPLSNKEIHDLFEKNKKDDDKKFETKKENPENEKKEYEGWYTDEREDGTWYQIGKRPVPIPSEWKSDNGSDYVLSFKNQGIKQFDFKGYKISNPKDYEYPDGINLIGTKGGTVSLTGVGKIEIPEGALDKEIFITMKQELSSYEQSYIDYEDSNRKKGWDYISPVVKFEPFNLELKKGANVSLNINLSRLGNNDVSLVQNFNAEDKIQWTPFNLYFSNGSLLEYENTSGFWGVRKLNYLSTFIRTDILPTDGSKSFTLDDLINEEKKSSNFKINSLSSVLDVYKEFVNEFQNLGRAYTEHFVYIKRPHTILNNSEIATLAMRAEKAYDYYKNDLNYNKPKAIQFESTKKNFYIPIYIEYGISGKENISAVDLDGGIINTPTGSIGYLPNYDSVEHEIFHFFQNDILIKNSGWKDFVSSSGKYKWAQESTAEYMGARTYKELSVMYEKAKQINLIQLYPKNSAIKSNYNTNLTDGLLYLAASKKIPYENLYHETPFFTYLASDKTKGVSIIKSMLDNKKTYLENFHDFTIHALLEDRFDIYNTGGYIVPFNDNVMDANRNTIENSKNPEIVLSAKENPQKTFVKLENNSAKYLFFKSNYNKKNPTLGISVKTTGSGCESTSKIRVLFYDSSGNIVVLPQYLNEDNPDLISKDYYAKFTGTALNLEISEIAKIYPFFNFGEDFSKAVLIISNSNGQLEGGNTCNYEVESCLLCFDNK